MLESELVIMCPELYHMAEDGSWPSIQRHGLLSTSALLTKWGYTGDRREKIESEYRSKKSSIYCDEYGEVVIRDQIPMPEESLKACLTDGMTPNEWYRLINGKIFFWTTEKSLQIFLAAREYKNDPQLVIKVDTHELLRRHADQVTLSSINSGSTYYDPKRYDRPALRGPRTFKLIQDYNINYIRELVVEEGIQDISRITISVERWVAHRKNYEDPRFEKLEEIFHR